MATPPGSSFKPQNPLEVPRFGGLATFSRLPYVADLKANPVDLAVLGVPFDGGTTYRPGARFAPRAIRDASVLNRNYSSELGVDLYQTLKAADIGDASVNPLNLTKTFEAIKKRVLEAQSTGARVLTLGGDHSILIPILEATHETYRAQGPITLVQFDAHTDTAEQAWGEPIHHGTPIRRLIEKGVLTGDHIFQIGIRGPLTSATQDDYCREQGINILDMVGFHDSNKRTDFLTRLRKTAGNGPVYVTFDVDGVDPAFTPGTGTPVVGGLTSYEALSTIRALAGLKIIGGDVVEVAPAYDHSEITSLFASAVIFEIMALIALSERSN